MSLIQVTLNFTEENITSIMQDIRPDLCNDDGDFDINSLSESQHKEMVATFNVVAPRIIERLADDAADCDNILTEPMRELQEWFNSL